MLPQNLYPGAATRGQTVKRAGAGWALALLMALSAVWLLLWCVPAFAHASLTEAYPADGATLTEPPEQVQLRFNEPVEAEFDPITVYGQEGDRVDEEDARVAPDDRRVLVADLGELPEGSYTVAWRVTSADGHPINGGYEFAVDASATGAETGSPIVPVERSVEQEEEAGSAWGTVLVAILALLLVCALAAAGLVALRRHGSAV